MRLLLYVIFSPGTVCMRHTCWLLTEHVSLINISLHLFSQLRDFTSGIEVNEPSFLNVSHNLKITFMSTVRLKTNSSSNKICSC